MLAVIFGVLALAGGLVSAADQAHLVDTSCVSDEFLSTKPTNEAGEVISSGQRSFSVDLIKLLFSEFNQTGFVDKNIFVSPFSIYQSLLLSYFGAAGQTQDELSQVLGLSNVTSKESVKKSYLFQRAFQTIRQRNADLGYTLMNANKLYFDRKLELSQCMQLLLSGELEAVDFSKNAEKARKSINQWVEENTLKKIRDLLPDGAVDDSTEVVLVNAAYFKGLWASQFQPNDTKTDNFYVRRDIIRSVEFMKQKGRFNYYPSEELRAHLLELPYLGEDISLVIILPPFEDDGLYTTVQKLNPLTLQAAMAEIRSGFYEVEDLNVELPKFRIEQSFELSSTLYDLGIKTLFDQSQSNLTEFLEKDAKHSRVAFSSAIHKSFIEVNEEGSEAAAATALFGFRSARPLFHTDFIANHPFLFLIYDKKSDVILFFGVFHDPKL